MTSSSSRLFTHLEKFAAKKKHPTSQLEPILELDESEKQENLLARATAQLNEWTQNTFNNEQDVIQPFLDALDEGTRVALLMGYLAEVRLLPEPSTYHACMILTLVYANMNDIENRVKMHRKAFSFAAAEFEVIIGNFLNREPTEIKLFFDSLDTTTLNKLTTDYLVEARLREPHSPRENLLLGFLNDYLEDFEKANEKYWDAFEKSEIKAIYYLANTVYEEERISKGSIGSLKPVEIRRMYQQAAALNFIPAKAALAARFDNLAELKFLLNESYVDQVLLEGLILNPTIYPLYLKSEIRALTATWLAKVKRAAAPYYSFGAVQPLGKEMQGALLILEAHLLTGEDPGSCYGFETRDISHIKYLRNGCQCILAVNAHDNNRLFDYAVKKLQWYTVYPQENAAKNHEAIFQFAQLLCDPKFLAWQSRYETELPFTIDGLKKSFYSYLTSYPADFVNKLFENEDCLRLPHLDSLLNLTPLSIETVKVINTLLTQKTAERDLPTARIHSGENGFFQKQLESLATEIDRHAATPAPRPSLVETFTRRLRSAL